MNFNSYSSESSEESGSGTESESEGEYEQIASMGARSYPLQYDSKSIENLILQISDRFDFRVVMSGETARTGLLVTTGLTIAGGLLGRHYGGKLGAAVGGAIGGACGIGIVVVSMRSLWNEIKEKLSDLFDLVYEYLAQLGLEDYKRAATFLATHGCNVQLGMLILETTSGIIGKKILSSLTST